MATRVTATIHMPLQHAYVQATIEVDGAPYADQLDDARCTVGRILNDELDLLDHRMKLREPEGE